jgi:hypothetical protein
LACGWRLISTARSVACERSNAGPPTSVACFHCLYSAEQTSHPGDGLGRDTAWGSLSWTASVSSGTSTCFLRWPCPGAVQAVAGVFCVHGTRSMGYHTTCGADRAARYMVLTVVA